MRWGCEALSFKILNTYSVIGNALEFSVVLVLLTLAVVAQVCCVLLLLHICFLGWKRTVTHQEVPCRVVDDKGRRPPAQVSVLSILVVVVVAVFAAVVVVVDAVVVAQALRHIRTHAQTHPHTLKLTHTHTHTHHTRCVTRRHTRTHVHSHTHSQQKPNIFNIHVANGSSALLPFRRVPGGLAVRRFEIASAPAGVPGTHSWRSLGM